MISSIASWLAVGLAAASVAGIAFHLAAARLVRRFMRAPRPEPVERPAVSVLKPLCGVDADLERNLRTVCDQAYPRFQVVLGLADAADPAAALAGRIAADGGADVTVVVDSRRYGSNLKLDNLQNMLPQAKHPVLLLADSDIAADPRHLDDMVTPLADPAVGVVTCLYVGRPAGGLASRLGALGVNCGFLPSALVARALGRADGCFGSGITLRRETLEAVGGLKRFKDVLADDWALGAAVRALGLKIALAARPVALTIDDADLKALFAHELRWGRTIAAIDRASYIASVVTQPVALALLAALLGGPGFLGLAVAAAAARFVAVRCEERALGLPSSSLALIALREAFSFVVFLFAVAGRSVSWRGKRFRVRSDGTMELLGSYPS